VNAKYRNTNASKLKATAKGKCSALVTARTACAGPRHASTTPACAAPPPQGTEAARVREEEEEEEEENGKEEAM